MALRTSAKRWMSGPTLRDRMGDWWPAATSAAWARIASRSSTVPRSVAPSTEPSSTGSGGIDVCFGASLVIASGYAASGPSADDVRCSHSPLVIGQSDGVRVQRANPSWRWTRQPPRWAPQTGQGVDPVTVAQSASTVEACRAVRMCVHGARHAPPDPRETFDASGARTPRMRHTCSARRLPIAAVSRHWGAATSMGAL